MQYPTALAGPGGRPFQRVALRGPARPGGGQVMLARVLDFPRLD
jgi:hypothetical protein